MSWENLGKTRVVQPVGRLSDPVHDLGDAVEQLEERQSILSQEIGQNRDFMSGLQCEVASLEDEIVYWGNACNCLAECAAEHERAIRETASWTRGIGGGFLWGTAALSVLGGVKSVMGQDIPIAVVLFVMAAALVACWAVMFVRLGKVVDGNYLAVAAAKYCPKQDDDEEPDDKEDKEEEE